ncbi:hypothetical protein BGZ76_007861 [Entomortierella beljakovae]|nr:hypothetical protein BGZ76_007861 [Entomortierella beljakovae]
MSKKFAIDLNVKPGDDLQDEEMAEVSDTNIKRKGRGFQSGDQSRDGVHGSSFERLNTGDDSASGRALKSVEGWIVLITGVHEEATEEEIHDKFGEYGEIKNIHMNQDRRTEEAIAGMNGEKLLGQTLACDFAFVKPQNSNNNDDRGRRGFTSRSRGGNTGHGGGRRTGGRSSSPSRRG